jgi:hypothetical protein
MPPHFIFPDGNDEMAFHRSREGCVVVSGALPPEHAEAGELEEILQL